MPNSYFQFKQFRIEQDKCAMKVSTDACILGAYTAQNYAQQAQHILDIGAGTGLLSLMLAQATQGQITAVEIDENTLLQAKENFEKSPWASQLNIVNQSIQHFEEANQYDLLICNPPFFVNSLKSNKSERNLARHTDSLPFEDLLICADKLAKNEAIFLVLLPLKEFQLFEKELYKNDCNFFIIEKLFIQDNPSKSPHRVILTLKREIGEKNKESAIKITEKTLLIKDIEQKYTENFVDLMKEYYLYL